VTVAAIRQPISLADQFGVIEVDDADQRKIGQFLEKPKNAKGLPDAPDEVLASMGNYVFDADVLVDAVTSDHDLEGTKHDMGGDIVPAFVNKGEGYVYDFKNNDVPGATERDRGYWRDVGTIDAYFEANMDLISIHPVFNLYNYEWPIYTTTGFLPPAKFVHGHGDRVGEALNSSVSPGCVISGAQVHGSVLAPRVKVHSYATIVDCVILDAVEIGRYATIRRAIIDKYTVIHEHAKIGIDHDHDRARGFHVTESGIVVVPRDSVVKA
jgi:glucose-1-phosphate adenylyltransferase